MCVACGALNGSMRAYSFVPLEAQMLDINISALKDDESWRRLTVLLLDSAVSDQRLETIRAHIMGRIRSDTRGSELEDYGPGDLLD